MQTIERKDDMQKQGGALHRLQQGFLADRFAWDGRLTDLMLGCHTLT